MTTIKATTGRTQDASAIVQSALARPMIDDREIWRAAQNMIDRYGEGALTQINIRIGELERQGDPGARSAWLRIRAAARTLLDAADDETRH